MCSSYRGSCPAMIIWNTPTHAPRFPLPQFRVRVESLEYVERFCGVVELPHLVAVVGDELQQTERLCRRLHLQVQLPRQTRLAVHDVCHETNKTRLTYENVYTVGYCATTEDFVKYLTAASQPTQVDVIRLDLFALNQLCNLNTNLIMHKHSIH